jgi:hypothetical protein
MPCHAALRHGLEKLLSKQQGCGMAYVNQTWPHCGNQMGETKSKPSAAWNGMGQVWEQHGVCETAFIPQCTKLNPICN